MRARPQNHTLGLVASHKRAIKSGTLYNQYFDLDKVEGDEVELMSAGTVFDTLKFMGKIVNSTLTQTKKIAQKLKGSTELESCKALWEFLYNHVQYTKDNPLREQLRTPIRTWKDRTAGVDCDCYSIFISSVLSNLSIKHCFRMAAYQNDFQHVYVVATVNGKPVIIDPVTDKFNYEVPYSKKHDSNMKVTMLNGGTDSMNGTACEKKPYIKRIRVFEDNRDILRDGKLPTAKFLRENAIPYAEVLDTDKSAGMIQINTANGLLTVPTIVTTAQGQQIITAYHAAKHTEPIPTPCEQKADEKKKKFSFWLMAGLAVAGIYLLGSESDNDKAKAKPLEGIPHKSKRKHRVKTLHV